MSGVSQSTVKITASATNAVALDLFTYSSLVASAMITGFIELTVKAHNNTDYQAFTGRVRWTAVNKAGTIRADVGAIVEDSISPSAGTLQVDVGSVTVANGVKLQVTVTTSLSSPTISVIYSHDES